MITLSKNNFAPYTDLHDVTTRVVIYDGILEDIPASYSPKEIYLPICVSLYDLTKKFYSPRKKGIGTLVYVCLEKSVIEMKNKRTGDSIHSKISSGSILILGAFFREDWKFSLSSHVTSSPKNRKIFRQKIIVFYEKHVLPYIYLDTGQRIAYSQKITDCTKELESLPIWKQCPQKHLKFQKILGKGCYGNVFQFKNTQAEFAIKISKAKKEAMTEKNCSSWSESFILEKIIRPIIQKNMCPNLPLLSAYYTCDSCELELENKKDFYPCISTILELASGDFKKFLKQNPSCNEVKVSMFQILAALHAIQMEGQIMNYDVKKENVLYYSVESGGYWEYTLRGKSYHVPNYGKLFILNDFGISRSMSPKFVTYKNNEEKTFRLGSRYGVIVNGIIQPLEVKKCPDEEGNMVNSDKITWEEDGKKTKSKGGHFRLDRKNGKIIPIKLEKSSLNPDSEDFFLQPDIIPPFEFYNDTQDAIRMFIGGKRTTQRGNHKKVNMDKEFLKEISKYEGKGENMNSHIFSTDPAQILAGHLLEKLFECYAIKSEDFSVSNTYKIATYHLP